MTSGIAVGRSRRLSLLLAAGVAAAVAVALAATISGPADTASDTAAGVQWLVRPFAAITLPALLCLLAVSVLHYAAAAAAARAAAGVSVPTGELVAAQFAAAAANRLTPAGLGGATVLGRFFVRRGRLEPPRAAAAVSSLAVLGALADVLAFAGLVAVGAAAGYSSMAGEAPTLLRRLAGVLPLPTSWPAWTAVGLLVAAVAGCALGGGRGRRLLRRVAGAARTYGHEIGALLRRPGRLATLMGASAATTLLLAAGFAAMVTLSPTGAPGTGFGALMIGYMIAAAAGNALPTPGGIGSADAAFVGVLLAAHVPVGTAVATVLAFRLVTFWLPAVAGLFVAHPLRRRGAL